MIEDARIVELLTQALKSGDPAFRVSATWAFARTGDARGIEQLNQLLNDNDSVDWVRASARNALKKIKSKKS